MALSQKDCIPCRGGVPPLPESEVQRLQKEIPGWSVVRNHHLERKYTFPDFKSALKFVNGIGEIADAQGHHPDIYLTWGKVRIEIFTHAIDGLTESDFILAAKFDRVPS